MGRRFTLLLENLEVWDAWAGKSERYSAISMFHVVFPLHQEVKVSLQALSALGRTESHLFQGH